MRQAEKEENKFQSRISFKLDPGRNFPKKIAKKFKKLKNPFPVLFLALNSVLTRPRQENSLKNSKKHSKIKKPHSGIISSQNRIRQAEKERKKFQSRIPLILDPGKKIPKKIGKKLKKLKNLFPALFLAKTSPGQREKNCSSEFRSYSTRPRKLRKKQQKNFKN